MKHTITLTLLAFALCIPLLAADLPPTRGEVINIVQWDGGELPKVYERSSQMPFTRSDLARLAQSDFAPELIAQMVIERRFVGDASAEGLIALRNDGLSPEVIRAVSMHALPPNQALNFTFLLNFEGASWAARKRYLYIIVPDGDTERVFTADLGTVLSGAWRQDIVEDRTDPLLARQIRRIAFSGSVPMKTYGQKAIHIFTSARPDIYRHSDIPQADLPGVKTAVIDYPVSSLRQDIRLTVRFKQDLMLPDKWQMTAAHIETEWE